MKVAREAAIAFEIIRNGRGVCIAGLQGKPGVVTAIVTWVDRQGHDDLMLDVGALDSETREHLVWARQSLRVGDEVVVRVVEDKKTTRVRSRKKQNENDERKRERLWLRKVARKYDYKLVKLRSKSKK